MLTCANRDSAQLGYLDKKSNNETLHYGVSRLNPDSLALLSSVIRFAGDKAKVILILVPQPIWGRNIQFDGKHFAPLFVRQLLCLQQPLFLARIGVTQEIPLSLGAGNIRRYIADTLSLYLAGIR